GVREYGVTDDSRIEAQGLATVRVWALNRVQDAKGNYFTIRYNENNATGEYSPAQIDYTGNAAATPQPLQPYNSIRFGYGPRTDVSARYEGGSLQQVTQLLTRIESYTDGTLVRSYALTYDTGGSAAASRLVAVTECA